MVGPPLGLWFSKEDREMWQHGVIVDYKEKAYIVHVDGIIKKVSKLCKNVETQIKKSKKKSTKKAKKVVKKA